ncbi:SLBB domain-containing protein [Vibrio astriarenae]
MRNISRIFLLFAGLLLSILAWAKPVQIGDLVQVNLPGESTLNRGFQVDKNGRINLPEVGPTYVAGYDEEQLQRVVSDALSTAFRDVTNARIYVSERQILVSIQGYVRSPGEYTLPESSTVQMALYAAGGLRPGAQLDKLQLKRGSTRQDFNYKRFLDTGDSQSLPVLQSLDAIFVPASPLVGNIEQEFDAAKLANSGDSADSRMAIKVFGEVNAPGSFSYKENTDLVDIIMRSGGVTRYASVEQIRVISDNTPTLFNLKQYLDSGDASLLPTLTPGSTVFVPKMEEEIKAGANTVYVMGEVAAPGAFEGNKGATFMDILANAGGPTRFAESRQIRVLKASGEVIKFDLTAYTEGLNGLKPPPIQPGDAIFVPEKTDMNEKSWLKISPDRAVNVMGEVVRPGRIEWSDEMDLMDLLAHVGGPTLRADTTKLEIATGRGPVQVFDLDQYIKNGARRSELPEIYAGTIIRIHDLPQDPSDNKSQWVRQSSDASIYVFGQVNAPGRYRFTKEMHFLDILSAADGPTKDADIHNIRVTHRDKSYAKVSKLNLSLYFETGDESILPIVLPGDTIYIPEKDKNWLDRPKETTVRVLGAVRNPGRYVFDDNMTILDLLAEAGGPTEFAYLEKISVVNLSCCQNQARTFDLIEFSKTAQYRDLPVIRTGDTVYIPHRRDSFMEKARNSLDDVLRIATAIALIGAL